MFPELRLIGRSFTVVVGREATTSGPRNICARGVWGVGVYIRHRSYTLSGGTKSNHLRRFRLRVVTREKETCPSKLQKKKKKTLDIGALNAVDGFRESRIPSYAVAIVFDRPQRLAPSAVAACPAHSTIQPQKETYEQEPRRMIIEEKRVEENEKEKESRIQVSKNHAEVAEDE